MASGRSFVLETLTEFADKGKVTSEHAPLSAMFLGQAHPPASAASELEPLLRQIADEARSAWPTVKLAPEPFVRYLAERIPAGGDVVSKLRALHTSDLYLACACVEGNPEALAAFEQAFVPRVPEYLARGRAPEGFIADVKQELRARLLAPRPGQERRIGLAAYSGRGPLGAWVRMAALRAAVDLDRAPARPPDAYRFEAQATAPAVDDPEMAVLRRQCAALLNHAVEKTLAALPPHEATLIRLFFLQSATYEAISRMYHITKSQARGRIASLREKIVQETRRCLVEELALTATHLDSVIQVALSELDTSIVAVLKRS